MTLSTGCLLDVVLTLAEPPEEQIYRLGFFQSQKKRFEAGLVWTRRDQTKISDPRKSAN